MLEGKEGCVWMDDVFYIYIYFQFWYVELDEKILEASGMGMQSAFRAWLSQDRINVPDTLGKAPVSKSKNVKIEGQTIKKYIYCHYLLPQPAAFNCQLTGDIRAV